MDLGRKFDTRKRHGRDAGYSVPRDERQHGHGRCGCGTVLFIVGSLMIDKE